MSYFGNARALYQGPIRYYSDVWWWDWEEEKGEEEKEDWLGYYRPTRKSPFMYCDQGLEYYQKAMELSKDKEFRAKCCFMAAKAEQNAFFINKPAKYMGDFRAGNYFHLLKGSFHDTQYYQEVINECGYFNTFVNNKQK
jgi:hypothetical protein